MKVSVIVPSDNYGHLILETLDSVLSQTYKEWECIIVDDGSTDNTRQVVEKYVQRDGRFEYIHLHSLLIKRIIFERHGLFDEAFKAAGVERRQLSLIKKLLSESGVRFTIEAILDWVVKRSIPCRYRYYLLECYGRRYARFLRNILENLLLIFEER